MTEATHNCLTTVFLNGQMYAPGETLTATEAEAEQLGNSLTALKQTVNQEVAPVAPAPTAKHKHKAPA